jgi:hypothetical protein
MWEWGAEEDICTHEEENEVRNNESHNFYFSLNVINVVKSSRMRLVRARNKYGGDVERVESIGWQVLRES